MSDLADDMDAAMAEITERRARFAGARRKDKSDVSTLRACRHCNGAPRIRVNDGGARYAQCGCGKRTAAYAARENAVTEWNTTHGG